MVQHSTLTTRRAKFCWIQSCLTRFQCRLGCFSPTLWCVHSHWKRLEFFFSHVVCKSLAVTCFGWLWSHFVVDITLLYDDVMFESWMNWKRGSCNFCCRNRVPLPSWKVTTTRTTETLGKPISSIDFCDMPLPVPAWLVFSSRMAWHTFPRSQPEESKRFLIS